MVDNLTASPIVLAEIRVIRIAPREVVADLETDAGGKFQAELPDGDYRLEVGKSNYLAATALWTGKAATIRLVRLGAFAGQVSDAQGRPMPGALVFVLPASPAAVPLALPSNPKADDQGRYRAFGVPPGRYVIGAGTSLFPNNTSPEVFTFAGGEEYRVNFQPPASITYRIRGTIDPAPPGAMALSLIAKGLPSVAIASKNFIAYGEIELDGIPPGSYDLLVSGPSIGYGSLGAMLGKPPIFGRTHIEVGDNIEDVKVVTQKAVAASFILKAPEGVTLTGCLTSAKLTLIPSEDWHAMMQSSATLSFAKEQSIEGLAPGRHRVTITGLGEKCDGPAAMEVDFSESPTAPIAIVVSPASSINGHAKDSSVTLVPLEQTGAGIRVAAVDAELRFHFDDVHPGRYRVIAAGGSVDVTVAGGKPVEVQMPAPQ